MIALGKAVIVAWEELERWNIPAGAEVRSDLPEGWQVVAMGDIVRPIANRIRVEDNQTYKMAGVRWYGEGVFHRETVKGSNLSATQISPLVSGALIYNRLFGWKAAFGVVPKELTDCFVSSEFPQFAVNPVKALPAFLNLYLLLDSTIRRVNAASVGSTAVSRNRFKEEEFLKLRLALPPKPTQEAIVAQWDDSTHRATALQAEAEDAAMTLEEILLDALGTPPPAQASERRRSWVVDWSEMDRWSVTYLENARNGRLGFVYSRFPIEPLGKHLAGTMNGLSTKPDGRVTLYRTLKLNALTPDGLDLAAVKPTPVDAETARRFSLVKDDLLICRSVGSFDQVAKCALIEEDNPMILFPDIMIRARMKPSLIPAYVREVIQSSVGRSFFQANARTAVGMWKIGADDIRNFPIPVPPKPVQEAVVARMHAVREAARRNRNEAAETLRRAKAEVEAVILGTKKTEEAGYA